MEISMQGLLKVTILSMEQTTQTGKSPLGKLTQKI